MSAHNMELPLRLVAEEWQVELEISDILRHEPLFAVSSACARSHRLACHLYQGNFFIPNPLSMDCGDSDAADDATAKKYRSRKVRLRMTEYHTSGRKRTMGS